MASKRNKPHEWILLHNKLPKPGTIVELYSEPTGQTFVGYYENSNSIYKFWKHNGNGIAPIQQIITHWRRI